MSGAAPSQPFDRGLQAERTLLAWRRTALSLALAGVIAVRFTVEELGPLGVAAGSLGALLAVAVAGAAHLRYRATHTELHRSGTLRHGAVLVALLCLAVLLIGLLAAAFVLVRVIVR